MAVAAKAKLKQEVQCTRWCFTLNNPTDQEKIDVNSWCYDSSYLIAGNEVGDTGTPHLQGFIVLMKKVRLTQLKKKCNDRAHWTPAAAATQKTRFTAQKMAIYLLKMVYLVIVLLALDQSVSGLRLLQRSCLKDLEYVTLKRRN
jgi:hypothetical protein